MLCAGTFPVVALMTGDAITRLTHDLPICAMNSTNETADVDVNPCSHSECEQMQVDIAVSLSVLVGILMVSSQRWRHSPPLFSPLPAPLPLKFTKINTSILCRNRNGCNLNFFIAKILWYKRERGG